MPPPTYAPPTPQNVLTNVPSIASLLGQNGLLLRVDDGGASGYSDGSATGLLEGAVIGATATTPIIIQTNAPHGLNTGDYVSIQGVQGQTYANGIWVITYVDATHYSLQGSEPALNQAYVGGTGAWQGITYPALNWFLQAVMVGTAKVKTYTQTLYDSQHLMNSWTVWNYATICATHWLCWRRQNPVPQSINNSYQETMDMLVKIQLGEIAIEDSAYRNEILPTWSNLRIDRRFNIKQLRVLQSVSGRVAPQFPRHWDLTSQLIGPIELNGLVV